MNNINERIIAMKKIKSLINKIPYFIACILMSSVTCFGASASASDPAPRRSEVTAPVVFADEVQHIRERLCFSPLGDSIILFSCSGKKIVITTAEAGPRLDDVISPDIRKRITALATAAVEGAYATRCFDNGRVRYTLCSGEASSLFVLGSIKGMISTLIAYCLDEAVRLGLVDGKVILTSILCAHAIARAINNLEMRVRLSPDEAI